MKKLTITLLCLLSVTYGSIQAEVFQFGPRLAINNSNLKIKSEGNNNFEVKSILGYQAGVLARFNLPMIYIQPELLVTRSGTNYKWKGTDRNLRYTKLELPVMVGTSLLGLARIQVGPTLGLLLTAKENIKKAKDITDVKINYEPLSLGWQAGIGADLGRFILDLKYEGGLTKFGNKLAGVPTEHGPSLWILSVGFNVLQVVEADALNKP
jgi:hypothetical protein